MILSCRRKDGINADTNLTDITYNKEAIASFLDTHNIQTIFFTSRFAADRFNRYFKEVRTAHPEVTLVTLPSPSPRYARMQEDEKIARYRILLPH